MLTVRRAHVYPFSVSTIKDQLVEVFEASELSMSELSGRAGIERTKLLRRFKGERALKTGAGSAEPEAIAKALGGRFVFVPNGYRVVPKTKRAA
jgi:hypothetical protein